MRIEIKNLKKSYGDTTVLQGIDLCFEEGKFYGLLGPNGAGKTTLFNILIHAIKKSSGEVIWQKDQEVLALKEVQQHLGVVFQQNNLDEFLTVKENLFVRGRLYGMSKQEIQQSIEEIDSYLAIKNILHQRYGRLSGGQKRKCDIARALIHQPSILLLDEPTTALDPKTRTDLWKAIKFLNKSKGMTIILITHYLEEMESCDLLNVLIKGKLTYSGNVEGFIEANAQTSLRIQVNDCKVLEKLELDKNYDVAIQPDGFIVNGVQITETLDLLSMFHQKGWIKDFKVEKASLENAYLNLLNTFESEEKCDERTNF
jgi:multidrug/hemolysin transport system ATP-binding protein